jgi:two-component system chemotaxis response regulator CheY
MTTNEAPRKTVMLVDDDDDMREVMATLLEEQHYHVVQAANGAEALRLLEDGKAGCNIILLDLMMPVMNGWDFCRHQKQKPEWASIPVVLMSSGAQIAFVVDGFDAADYVSKPVEIADLIDKVRRHCG